VFFVALTPAGAQQFTPFETQRDTLNHQMHEVMDEVNNLSSILKGAKYCSAAERNADGLRVAELSDQVDRLESQYAQAKSSVQKQAVNQISGPQMSAAEDDPTGKRFWAGSDSTAKKLRTAMNNLQSVFRATQIIDCTPPKPVVEGPQTPPPPPPPPPPVPQQDPLAGLTQPEIILAALPVVPRFCTQADKDAYYNNVFKPAYDQAYAAFKAAGDYSSALMLRRWKLADQLDKLELSARKNPVNPNEIAELKREIDVVKAAEAAFEPMRLAAYSRFAEFIAQADALLKAPIEDCGEHFTTPNPPPVGPIPPPTGSAPSEPPPLDLRRPHVPDAFCSEKERDEWIEKNLQPVIDKAMDQVDAWEAYDESLVVQQAMPGDAQYHGRISRLRTDADASLAQAKNFLELVRGLRDEARHARIKDCGPHFSIGIGIGVGGGGDDRHQHGDSHHGDSNHGDDSQGTRPPNQDTPPNPGTHD
jgi:hypothetical protein